MKIQKTQVSQFCKPAAPDARLRIISTTILYSYTTIKGVWLITNHPISYFVPSDAGWPFCLPHNLPCRGQEEKKGVGSGEGRKMNKLTDLLIESNRFSI